MKSKILSVGMVLGQWPVLLGFAGNGLAQISPPDFATLEPKANSCETWTKVRNTGQNQIYEGWVLGYLSGANVFGDKPTDFLVAVDAKAVLAWIDNHCKANPLDKLTVPVKKLADELNERVQPKRR